MDEVCTKLIAIFQIVNDWLKFAETKNAVLFTFTGAAVAAIITMLSALQKIPQSLRIASFVSISLLCICALLTSLSFLPKTALEYMLWSQAKPSRNSNFQPRDTDNFYFFGHLQKYNPKVLLNALNKHYFEGRINVDYKKEYLDIASQIIINSRITFLKLRLFTYALCILIASILVIPFSMLISLIVYRKL